MAEVKPDLLSPPLLFADEFTAIKTIPSIIYGESNPILCDFSVTQTDKGEELKRAILLFQEFGEPKLLMLERIGNFKQSIIQIDLNQAFEFGVFNTSPCTSKPLPIDFSIQPEQVNPQSISVAEQPEKQRAKQDDQLFAQYLKKKIQLSKSKESIDQQLTTLNNELKKVSVEHTRLASEIPQLSQQLQSIQQILSATNQLVNQLGTQEGDVLLRMERVQAELENAKDSAEQALSEKQRAQKLASKRKQELMTQLTDIKSEYQSVQQKLNTLEERSTLLLKSLS
ncbi:coiled-coil domain-containing protein [Parashewanella tropica]|uniref:coiled-coil domain-containing protein n=1 Tax=Parashewanella tropica TaxID=2547970 RepID=UPI00105A50A3|nr:hypothetical protein [Parashewanella tropica]